MSELLCEGTGQMQVSGWFTCTITGHRMGAGGNEISSCVAGASKVCSLPLRFSRAGGIEFRHEGERGGGGAPLRARWMARTRRERPLAGSGWAAVTLLLPIMARLCAYMSRRLIEKLIYEKKLVGSSWTTAVRFHSVNVMGDRFIASVDPASSPVISASSSPRCFRYKIFTPTLFGLSVYFSFYIWKNIKWSTSIFEKAFRLNATG